MTIFVSLMKTLLQKHIEYIFQESIAADQSILNYSRNFFGVPRNSGLSAEKQSVLTHLIESIKSFVDKETDLLSCSSIKGLVHQALDMIKRVRIEYGNHPAGTTEKSLSLLCIVIDEVYKKISSIQVLNIPDDKDPFNIFQYEIANYFTLKIEHEFYPTIINTITRHPLFTKYPKLELCQEVLLLGDTDSSLSQIEQCKRQLEDIKEDVRDSIKRCNLVEQFILTLQHKNISIFSTIEQTLFDRFIINQRTTLNNSGFPEGGGDLGRYLQQAWLKIKLLRNLPNASSFYIAPEAAMESLEKKSLATEEFEHVNSALLDEGLVSEIRL